MEHPRKFRGALPPFAAGHQRPRIALRSHHSTHFPHDLTRFQANRAPRIEEIIIVRPLGKGMDITSQGCELGDLRWLRCQKEVHYRAQTFSSWAFSRSRGALLDALLRVLLRGSHNASPDTAGTPS